MLEFSFQKLLSTWPVVVDSGGCIRRKGGVHWFKICRAVEWESDENCKNNS